MDHAATPTPTFAGIDARRIAANTGVLALHAAALAVMLLPSSWTPEPQTREETVPIVFIEPRREPLPTTPPPPVRVQEVRVPPTVRPTPTQVPVQLPDPGPVMTQGDTYAEPVDATATVDSFEVGPPQLETLAYDRHPAPRYPRLALRRGLTGTVLLRVLVDETGQVKDVVIEQSSGHGELDRAAREQVLAQWRFHPAQRMGRAVPAYALVPIAFNLPR
ncbi:energy transducer TonB [Arenimonas sp. MALMAid1274]|uniref:energy transducer TonB n=1 Tax=Arenimonas sp. MALMAid1274 TaxID=3411630 RepID=UPI003B9F0407